MKVVIIPNTERDTDFRNTKKLSSVLISKGIDVFMNRKYAIHVEGAIGLDNDDELYIGADVIIVLGGDGSILEALTPSVTYGIPILALNLGRLGYIAQFEKGDEEKIAETLLCGFGISERSMINISVLREGEYILTDAYALNDAVVSKNSYGGVVEIELLSDGNPVTVYRGDGVIASTSTGSTAYSMSAGGPVIDPLLDVICITPICAHTLGARPVVFSKKSKISFRCLTGDGRVTLCIDGKKDFPLLEGDIVEIGLSDEKAKLVKTENYGFSRVLYSKMKDY